MNEINLRSTEKQLKERWLSSEGKKIREQVIEHITEDNWETLLKGFPYIEEVENGRDLRFIDLNNNNLTGANFSGANLCGANLSESLLTGANFRKANLSGADLSKSGLYNTNFSNANLFETNLKESISRESNLTNANLASANLGEAIFWNANLSGAELCKTNLVKTELNMTNFSKADIVGVIFNGTNLNNTDFSKCLLSEVKFNDCSIDEITFKSAVITKVNWGDLDIRKKYFKDLQPQELYGEKNYYELSETYLSLKNRFNENGRYNDMSWAYLKEKESLRLIYKQKIMGKYVNCFVRIKSVFKLLWECLLFYLFGYGEKPWHILGWSLITIIIFGVIYKVIPAIGSELSKIDVTMTFWRSLYFSTITFTTVGFGDFHPINDISRALVMIEAALGLFFYSLFVFSFGRRIAGR